MAATNPVFNHVRGAALAGYAVLLALVWLLPLQFGVITSDAGSRMACTFTESAGKYGSLLLVVITAFFYNLHERKRVAGFFRTAVLLLALLSAVAWLNEHGTKKLLRLPRPSHLYLLQQVKLGSQLDSLYQLTSEQRAEFFTSLVQNQPGQFVQVQQRVLEHWLDEPGSSFPSGHSFNAFLLACLMAYSLRQSTSHPMVHRFFFFPFLWAVTVSVSRVLVGAHTPLDVSAGAAMGVFTGLTFLYFDRVRHLILHRKKQA